MPPSSSLVFSFPAPSLEQSSHDLVNDSRASTGLSKEEEDLLSWLKNSEDLDADIVAPQPIQLEKLIKKNNKEQVIEFLFTGGSFAVFFSLLFLSIKVDFPSLILLLSLAVACGIFAYESSQADGHVKREKNIRKALEELNSPSIEQKGDLLPKIFHLSRNPRLHQSTKQALMNCFHLLDNQKGTIRFWKVVSYHVNNIENSFNKKEMSEKIMSVNNDIQIA